MKTNLLLSALSTVLPAGTAPADDEFYKTKNCFACHRIDRNTLGPSFKSVAAKYADDKSADVMLAKKSGRVVSVSGGKSPCRPKVRCPKTNR